MSCKSTLLWRAALTIVLATIVLGRPAAQQNDNAAPSDLAAVARFLEPAYEVALFQARASALAAAKDTRPEVKEFATRMRAFRETQLTAMAELARAHGLVLRDNLGSELRSILDNLQPLDVLELSRRYSEAEVQSLDREIAGYRRFAVEGEQGIKQYAMSTLPSLDVLAGAARKTFDAVRP